MEAAQSEPQEAPANPDRQVTEEVTVARYSDGTYSVGHFRRLSEGKGEGSSEKTLSREQALACATEMLG